MTQTPQTIIDEAKALAAQAQKVAADVAGTPAPVTPAPVDPVKAMKAARYAAFNKGK